MHCPACNKDFSPVHSRCPDCNGWLRTAKSSSANSRPSGSVAVPGGLAAPTEPSTQRVNAASVGVALPSRPTNKPANPPAAPPAPAARAGAGLGGDWGPTESPAPALGASQPVAAPRVAAEDNSFGGRGGLGSGWESSGSFAAPTPVPPPASSQWGGDGMATGRLAPPAPPSPPPASGGWGNGVSGGPAASGGWGAPAAPHGLGSPPSNGGWGAPAGGLGGGPAAPGGPGLGGGLGGPPSASSWGAPAAPSGPATGGGGGWLGDGGGGSPYAPPANKSSESWLGGGEAPAAPSSLAPPAASEMPLELPDHTVAVDLGTPWEEDEASSPGSSNKMTFMILGCLVLGLTVFSAYLFWQNSQLHQKPAAPTVDKGATSFKLGEDTWKKAQADFNAGRYEEAQASAELARDLLVPLKGYPKAKQVNAFYNKATVRLAQSLFEQARRANAAHETNQAIALCTQAATMYAKVKGTAKLQAQAYAYEAGIYRQIGDSTAAEASYKKAHSLNPSGGYASEARQVHASSAPVPVAPPPPADAPPAPVEQPSVGDGGAYPTGQHGGGYRPSAPAPAPAAIPSGPAPKPRPVNTYVPPPKRQPSRPSDQLPTYNH
ncbi:tetratricopeptide repeat protein [bacterium]|nr:tetratricopeptide repeat protein [bacterium]